MWSGELLLRRLDKSLSVLLELSNGEDHQLV